MNGHEWIGWLVGVKIASGLSLLPCQYVAFETAAVRTRLPSC